MGSQKCNPYNLHCHFVQEASKEILKRILLKFVVMCSEMVIVGFFSGNKTLVDTYFSNEDEDKCSVLYAYCFEIFQYVQFKF